MRNKNDNYPTPHSVIGTVLRNLDWRSVRCWEPCAGDGRFADAIDTDGCSVAETVRHDIATGHSFFEWREAQHPDLITNPPFHCIRDFIDHAFAIGVHRMALVCPERLWACKKGLGQWLRHRPTRWANLDWREDYLGKGGTPDRALAVAIWDTPHADRCEYEIWCR